MAKENWNYDYGKIWKVAFLHISRDLNEEQYRGWKKDNIDMSWKHNDNFFPYNTSFNIIDIVHFIKYNLSP